MRIVGEVDRGTWRLHLDAFAEYVAEQCLAKREFTRIAGQVEARLVHHVGEADPGVGIGESERATGPRGTEGVVRRAEETERRRLAEAERERRVDAEHLVMDALGGREGGARRRCSTSLPPGSGPSGLPMTTWSS